MNLLNFPYNIAASDEIYNKIEEVEKMNEEDSYRTYGFGKSEVLSRLWEDYSTLVNEESQFQTGISNFKEEYASPYNFI